MHLGCVKYLLEKSLHFLFCMLFIQNLIDQNNIGFDFSFPIYSLLFLTITNNTLY